MRFLLLSFMFLSVLIIGCGDSEHEEWVGTWDLHTIDGESYVGFEWVFNDDGTWEIRFLGISFDRFEIDDLDAFVGTYTVSGANYTIETEGSLPISGTWVISGSTLTLIDNDGTVTVLKRQ